MLCPWEMCSAAHRGCSCGSKHCLQPCRVLLLSHEGSWGNLFICSLACAVCPGQPAKGFLLWWDWIAADSGQWDGLGCGVYESCASAGSCGAVLPKGSCGSQLGQVSAVCLCFADHKAAPAWCPGSSPVIHAAVLGAQRTASSVSIHLCLRRAGKCQLMFISLGLSVNYCHLWFVL